MRAGRDLSSFAMIGGGSLSGFLPWGASAFRGRKNSAPDTLPGLFLYGRVAACHKMMLKRMRPPMRAASMNFRASREPVSHQTGYRATYAPERRTSHRAFNKSWLGGFVPEVIPAAACQAPNTL